MPVWHASGSTQPTTPIKDWSVATRRRIEWKLRNLLQGVGRDGAEHIEEGDIAIHFRKAVTLQEEDRVGGARDTRCPHGKAIWTPAFGKGER